jgi:hypothetical protein
VCLLPVSFLFLVVLGAALLLCIALPILAILYAWTSNWWQAAAFAAAWVPAFLFLRWWWRRERAGKNWGPL